MVGGDPVSDDVGASKGGFAQLSAGYSATAIGERLQAVAGGQYFHDHVLSGARVELRDVAVDVFDLSKRGW